MALMSNKIEMEKLRPGDHIYTWRSGYSYSHHGIYVGDGKVIHLTRGPGLIIYSSSRSQPSNDRVVCCSIQDFLCDSQLYRFEYGVSKILFLIKRPGTCSLASSNPHEQVLHRASHLLEYGFGNYDLLDKNCEDFAIFCKTGFVRHDKTGGHISGQIRAFYTAFIAFTIIPYRFLPASLIGLALVVCGLYCFFRLGLDVGFRSSYSDVVEVEKLEHNVRENILNYMMEESTTRWFLNKSDYIAYTLWAIRIWYWTPQSKILVWLKSVFLYDLLIYFVSDHLRLYGFKLGEYSASTIWILGYLYWRWRVVSKILLWTRSVLLFYFLSSFISDCPRHLQLQNYVIATTLVLELWYWTPESKILLWFKSVILYILFYGFVSSHLRIDRLKRKAFLLCFVIQLAALFCWDWIK